MAVVVGVTIDGTGVGAGGGQTGAVPFDEGEGH